MASGFVQRWQGKVLAKLLGVGSGGMTLYSATGGPTNVTPNELASLAGRNTVTAYSTQGAAISGNGIANISSTGIKESMTLAPPAAGIGKILAFLTVSSGIQINGAPATFDGTNSVMLSTVAGTVGLRGLSTSRWLIESIIPQSTVGASILTLSTST